MVTGQSPLQPAGRPAAAFTTTHWSVVILAGQENSPDATAALEKLCRTYWYPVYAWVRGGGTGPDDAHDLTQEFFAMRLRRDSLSTVERDKGR